MTSVAWTRSRLGGAMLVPRAFLRRDRSIELSYRAGILLRLGAAIVTTGTFFFLGRAFDQAAPGLTAVGGGYFAFVLIGIVALEFLAQAVGTFGGSIRESQTTGTLELMLLGPSRLVTLLASSMLWPYVSAALGAATYLVIGSALGVDLSRANVPAAIVGLGLLLVGFTGMGFLAGATVLVIKRGNPLGWALRGASVVLAGTFYPTTVLPPFLEALGHLLPMTHGLTVLRAALLEGTPITGLLAPLAALLVVSLAYLALGLAAFAAAVHHARTDGSLAQY